MSPKRLLAAGSIGGTGAGVAATGARGLLDGPGSTPGIVIAILGLALGLALAAGAVALYLSEVTTDHALRVAGWNLLGLVVLGAILALAFAHLDSFPVFVAGTILGVSAVAHVLIGVTDVRRIRVGELARQRERLAVLNRLVRHDLRHEAQVLLGAGSRIERAGDGGDLDAASETVTEVADRLTSMHENLGTIQRLMESETATSRRDLADLVDGAVGECRSAYPDAEIEVDIPDGLAVLATGDLATAITELVENAVEHNDEGTPHVRISTETRGDHVTLRVRDDGPGIPEQERTVVAGDREISQLDHTTGVGLWVARTVVESIGGAIGFENPPDGAAVVLSIPRA